MTSDGRPAAGVELAPDDPALFVFIPEHGAAVCADCHGFFLAVLGHCPGCGSRHFALPPQIQKPTPKERKAKK